MDLERPNSHLKSTSPRSPASFAFAFPSFLVHNSQFGTFPLTPLTSQLYLYTFHLFSFYLWHFLRFSPTTILGLAFAFFWWLTLFPPCV